MFRVKEEETAEVKVKKPRKKAPQKEVAAEKKKAESGTEKTGSKTKKPIKLNKSSGAPAFSKVKAAY